MGADQGIEQVFETCPEEQHAGMMELLDALDAQGFTHVSQRSRERSCATSPGPARRPPPAYRRWSA